MATTFTAPLLAQMSQLFFQRDEDQLQSFENELRDAAYNAGVGSEADRLGLTMAQWQIVRNPEETLRKAVLAAE